jgi:hypothetical protein
MSRRRRVLLWGLALVALAEAGWIGALLTEPNPSQRIEVGMTHEEVSGIFGRSADAIHYCRDGVTEGSRSWDTGGGVVLVCFDEGRVAEKKYVLHWRESIFDRLRRWLGL